MNSQPRLQVPREHGRYLTVPPLDEVEALLTRSEAEKHSTAQQEVLDVARAYLEEQGELVPDFDSNRILMAGHQPELFHPGVWIKNFALYGLALEHGRTPLNLIVDNDVVKSNALKVPPLTDTLPTVENVPPRSRSIYFADDLLGVPFEEATIHDTEQFQQVVNECQLPWDAPLRQFWNATGDSHNLGERFAKGRRALERQWGCHNLEVPLSRVCQTRSFARFVYQILLDLPRFQQIHNQVLAQYRTEHHLRSHSHPVPDLATEDDWQEAPFWIWRAGSRQRQRLWVRQTHGQLSIRNENITLPTEEESFIDAFRELESQGIKIRSRALMTTLFCRLFLADTFIHGIGGARYDELTDQIIEGFYHQRAPEYLTISGTLRLPIEGYAVTEEDASQLRWLIRDLQQNPQRHLSSADPEVSKLIAEKHHWFEKSKANEKERWQQLRLITEQLRRFVQPQVESATEQLQQCVAQLRVNRVLQRRDYAFCLFPEATIKSFCTQCCLIPTRCASE